MKTVYFSVDSAIEITQNNIQRFVINHRKINVEGTNGCFWILNVDIHLCILQTKHLQCIASKSTLSYHVRACPRLIKNKIMVIIG